VRGHERDLTGVEWLRLMFVDVFGANHSLQVPVSRLDVALERGIGFDGSALEGHARHLESDMLIRPDTETLVNLGDGVARAVCTVHTPDGERWRADPRYALESLLDHAPDALAGLTVGAEVEFYLLDHEGLPLDDAGYFDDAESPGKEVLREASRRLLACGVPVDQWHHEGGPGQYELDLGPLDPLGLADALLFTKQVLREVARAYGYRATFMARPFADQPGSGLHLHQRLPAAAVDGAGPLPAVAQHVVAGQLEHARGLCALAAPTVNSYKRLHSGPEAPGAVVWAHSNRAALVRVSAFQGAEASIEYRGADPSANPYLLLTGLLVAALDGVDSQLELAAPAEESAGGFDAQPTESRPEPLPRDLHAALDALTADDVLVDAFDHQLLARLLDGRRAEAEEYRGLVSDWEREQYLDRA